jgi:hypothetical protein
MRNFLQPDSSMRIVSTSNVYFIPFKFGLLGLSTKLAPKLKTLSSIFRSGNLTQTICGAQRGLFTLKAVKVGRKTNNSSKNNQDLSTV